jgi:sarcosine oxidase/L-pipecolate oxidase
LKFCKDASFTNKYKHEASGSVISTPPTDKPDERQSECPKILRHEIASVMQGIFGKEVEGLEIESYRICWYAALCLL